MGKTRMDKTQLLSTFGGSLKEKKPPQSPPLPVSANERNVGKFWDLMVIQLSRPTKVPLNIESRERVSTGFSENKMSLGAPERGGGTE
jgi:hypothetical protein